MRQRQPPHVHAQKREKTHFSLRRPPSTSSSTALNGLPPPHHRPCTALLPSSANTAQSPAGTRNVQHPPNQHHPPRFTGLPDANSSAPSSPSATIVRSPSRAWKSVLPYPFKTAHRASSDPSSYSLYTAGHLTDPGPTKINARPAHSMFSQNANY